MTWRAWATFATLCAIWGLPYFFIKLALQEICRPRHRMGADHAGRDRARADRMATRLAAESIRAQDGGHRIRGRGAGHTVFADRDGRAVDQLVAHRHPDRDGAADCRPHCAAVRRQGTPRCTADCRPRDRLLRRHRDRRSRYGAWTDAVGRRRLHHDFGRRLCDRPADRRALFVGCRRAGRRGCKPRRRVGPALAVRGVVRAGSRSVGAVARCGRSAGRRLHRARAVLVLLFDQRGWCGARLSCRLHQSGCGCSHRRARAERTVRPGYRRGVWR